MRSGLRLEGKRRLIWFDDLIDHCRKDQNWSGGNEGLKSNSRHFTRQPSFRAHLNPFVVSWASTEPFAGFDSENLKVKALARVFSQLKAAPLKIWGLTKDNFIHVSLLRWGIFQQILRPILWLTSTGFPNVLSERKKATTFCELSKWAWFEHWWMMPETLTSLKSQEGFRAITQK